MLYNLRVENIALIDKLNIEFSEGLNVLSGETGAGKSIIINSMNLILGERADRDLIRTGCDKARVEAVFYIDYNTYKPYLDELGIEESDELIISRELASSGRNICRVNGTAVNLNGLKKLMSQIVDIHSQNSNQMLLNPINHIKLLDYYLSGDAGDLKKEISSNFKQLRLLKRRLTQLGGSSDKRKREIDLLTYQINELEQASIESNELQTLEKEKDALMNSQHIAESLNMCYRILSSSESERSVIAGLTICEDKLTSISEYSGKYEKLLQDLRDHLYALEDLAQEINGYLEDVDFNEARIDEINERQNFIKSLMRKYNVHSEDEFTDLIRISEEKLKNLQNAGNEIKKISTDMKKERNILDNLYEELTKKRKYAGARLEEKVNNELNDLGMENAKFSVRISKDITYKYKENGLDNVEFFISTNLGEPAKPLSKIASGGEISRIMLALKNVFGKSDNTSTLIFDEIDTGISGAIALVVADKLASIALNKQVICVSHLPQIAVMADKNFLIEKKVIDNNTVSEIKEIKGDELINEIARLSGGIKSKIASEHAIELRKNAQKFKEGLKERKENV